MSFNLATYLSQNAAGVGLLGAVVGGSAAAAKTYRAHRRGLISARQALAVTGKESAGAGVATAASAVAAGLVGAGLVTALGAAFVAATVTKYGWDRAMDRLQSRSA